MISMKVNNVYKAMSFISFKIVKVSKVIESVILFITELLGMCGPL